MNELVQELKKKYLSEGYVANWGDGGIDKEDLCILRKITLVPVEGKEGKVRPVDDYVIISNHRTVFFYDVYSYKA